jgi:tetratricopeptide (TPR) repeat protein
MTQLKRNILFAILFFFIITACSRENKSLYDRYSGWIHKSHEEALEEKIDALIMDIQKAGKASETALSDLLDLSRLATEMRDADRAFEAGLRAQSMAEVLYGPKNEKTIRVYIQLADHAMTLFEPRLADNYLNKAMTAAAMAHPDNHELLAVIYGHYGDVYTAFRKNEDAEALYFKAIAMEELSDSHSVYIAEMETRLGILKESQLKYEMAEKFYQKALARENLIRGTFSPQSASLYNNLASVCFMTSRPEEAIQHLEKALQIWERQKGSHIRQAEIHSNLAEIYRALNDMEKAEKHYKIIKNLMKKIPEKIDLYPALLRNLSQYYLQTEESEKSRKMEEEARKVERILRNKHLENVSALENKFRRIPGMELTWDGK